MAQKKGGGRDQTVFRFKKGERRDKGKTNERGFILGRPQLEKKKADNFTDHQPVLITKQKQPK